MTGKRAKRLLVAVFVAAVAVATLVFVLETVNAEAGFAGTTMAAPLGWTLPLVVGLLIGGVAWILLLAAPNYSDDDLEPRQSVPCPSCGEPVMADWRMCPYCGAVQRVESVLEQHS